VGTGQKITAAERI